MPIGLDVQRTIKRAEIWSLHTALSNLIRPSEIYIDNRGVVEALTNGEVSCIVAGHKDADFWIRVWNKINHHSGQGLGLQVGVGCMRRTPDKDKEQRTRENK